VQGVCSAQAAHYAYAKRTIQQLKTFFVVVPASCSDKQRGHGFSRQAHSRPQQQQPHSNHVTATTAADGKQRLN
jgi:hypothetical protein